ncbi:histidine phosphatase family protein [Patescibacteria group bacterium]|nr:MAG: histidine phosphatase family protein [Patescibacteria group bacterium]
MNTGFMSKLILARHGATPYNAQGLWTGHIDVDMSEAGYDEVRQSAEFLASTGIDAAFCSTLWRARNTAAVILSHQERPNIPLLSTELLDEKNYGVFTGRNKHEVQAEVGDDAFMLIRRSWDYEIEGGESLQAVHERVTSLHHGVIAPLLEAGQTVLVASHNKTLRAYVKEVEEIPVSDTPAIELGTAEVRVYGYSAGAFELESRQVVGSVH